MGVSESEVWSSIQTADMSGILRRVLYRGMKCPTRGRFDFPGALLLSCKFKIAFTPSLNVAT